MKVLILLALICTVLSSVELGAAQTAGAAQDEGVRRLIASLPPNSRWRDMLQKGARGDGVRHSWMNSMHEEGIRLASITFEFAWAKRGKELKDWNAVEEQYFKDYDRFQALSDPEQLGQIDASLKRELEEAALSKAKSSNWLEYPLEEQGAGYRQILFADNEWLPVDLSPFLGRYEPGTTPLMHAALLEEVSRIKKLIGQGVDVNETSPDGSTALIYAATTDSSAAVDCLLKAGAHVNISMKGGGGALTTAVLTNHPRAVEVLLKAGADPNSKSVEGESALSIAKREHYAEIVQLLTHAGARQ